MLSPRLENTISVCRWPVISDGFSAMNALAMLLKVSGELFCFVFWQWLTRFVTRGVQADAAHGLGGDHCHISIIGHQRRAFDQLGGVAKIERVTNRNTVYAHRGLGSQYPDEGPRPPNFQVSVAGNGLNLIQYRVKSEPGQVESNDRAARHSAGLRGGSLLECWRILEVDCSQTGLGRIHAGDDAA